ncbi:MAG: outer membrane beta-barrel protein [Tatlockia sp.]|jgi:opacity protein-like surface antigen
MRIAFFSAALFASSLASAATPIDGLYGSLFGGYTYLPFNVNVNYLDPFVIGPYSKQISFNNGVNAGGRIGFQGYPLRYEAEVTYLNAKAELSRIRAFYASPFLQPKITGQTNAVLGLANVYYDFRSIIPCIAPYLGVGIGYGWVQSSVSNRTFFSQYRFTGSDSAFAYQGTAGVSYNFSESYSLTLAYRYIGTSKINELGKNFQAHLASLGVVYRFNEYNYK